MEAKVEAIIVCGFKMILLLLYVPCKPWFFFGGGVKFVFEETHTRAYYVIYINILDGFLQGSYAKSRWFGFLQLLQCTPNYYDTKEREVKMQPFESLSKNSHLKFLFLLLNGLPWIYQCPRRAHYVLLYVYCSNLTLRGVHSFPIFYANVSSCFSILLETVKRKINFLLPLLSPLLQRRTFSSALL